MKSAQIVSHHSNWPAQVVLRTEDLRVIEMAQHLCREKVEVTCNGDKDYTYAFIGMVKHRIIVASFAT